MTTLPSLLPPPFATAILLLVALFTAPLAAPVAAQDAGGARIEQNQRLMLSAEDVETHFYTPHHAHPHELMKVTERLHGRSFHVVEKGGYSAPPMNNMQLLGDSILIYDEPGYATKLLAALELLDRAPAEESSPTQLITRHWSPGFVALHTGFEAIQPFSRPIALENGQGYTSNISMLANQGVLVLRDSADQVEQMLALLAEIDQPEPQLMVTAMVIRGEREPVESDVPPELAKHLARMLPYQSFSMDAMGMVRSSARSRSIEVRLDQSNVLQFKPDAYDEATRTLSGQCEFASDTGFRFETRTSIAGGEYTVLGASGELAQFVVLRIEPLDG